MEEVELDVVDADMEEAEELRPFGREIKRNPFNEEKCEVSKRAIEDGDDVAEDDCYLYLLSPHHPDSL